MPHERDELKIHPDHRWGRCCSKSTVGLRFFGSVDILLTVQSDSRFVLIGVQRDLAMIEVIAVFFDLFSAGIFLAHAFDGYRSRA
jgi:hypothetical protein